MGSRVSGQPVIARFWRDRTTLLIACIAGLGTANILVRIATSPSPINIIAFLQVALNLLAGEGWRDFAGDPLTLWPPLFPLLLAAFGWVGIEPLEAGRWINAAAFGLTILVAGCWLRSNLRSQWLTLTATAIIAASQPLSHWASRLMTDPLFFLFTVLALIQLAAFLNRKIDAPLWWAAVFTALAAITRYPGVVLIGVGVLVLLVRRAPPLATQVKARHHIWGRLVHAPRRGADAQLGGLRDPDRGENWVRAVPIRWAEPNGGCIPGLGDSPQRARRVGLSPVDGGRAGRAGSGSGRRLVGS